MVVEWFISFEKNKNTTNVKNVLLFCFEWNRPDFLFVSFTRLSTAYYLAGTKNPEDIISAVHLIQVG